MEKINLNQGWNFKIFDKEKQTDLPSLNLSELIKLGKYTIEDYKDETLIDKIDAVGCSYEKSFELTEEQLKNDNLILFFERLDTLATVYLNNKLVAETSNMHLSYSFDVKDKLIPGKNIIRVQFSSFQKKIKEKQTVLKLPYNAMGVTGHPHIRKAACHFGWDFTTPLMMQGISGKCELLAYSHPVINNFSVRQKTNETVSRVEMKIEASENCTVKFTLESPDGSVIEKTSKNDEKAVFEVNNPVLWWCNGLGNQPLYVVTAKIVDENGNVLDERVKKIGLRSLELDRSDDKFGKNFAFVINGKTIFAKGANFIPNGLLYSDNTREDLYKLLSLAKEANMNMLRVWGGGFYESDDFYDICDELGILVWQDCAFACCAYPFMQKDFLDTVKEEITQNVLRIKHHASLALWCGNNEIESMSLAWINQISMIKSTGDFFYKVLPELIQKLDPDTAYHACSPSSGEYMKKMNSDDIGDVHIWNTWHGFQLKEYFHKRLSRFASEYGMQSYPAKGVKANQFCDLGDERLQYYLTKHFTMPDNLDDFRYLTQIMQLEYMKVAAEQFRQNQYRCHGCLFWQLNDCFNSISWAAVDVRNRKKAVMYGAKHFYEDIHVSCKRDKKQIKILITNDSNKDFKGKLCYFIEKTNSSKTNKICDSVSVGALSQKQIFFFDDCEINSKTDVLVMQLLDEDNNIVSENREIFCENNKLLLDNPNLEVETLLKAGKVFVTVTAKSYARYVEIQCGENSEASENFFDLSANESKTVEILSPEADFSSSLTVRSLYDVMKNRNKLQDKKLYYSIALKPMSIANRVSRWFEK